MYGHGCGGCQFLPQSFFIQTTAAYEHVHIIKWVEGVPIRREGKIVCYSLELH
jgi:hypothetical protein